MTLLTAIFPLLAILAGQPVTLPPDTFDLTGTSPIRVSNVIQGSVGTVIRYNQVEPSDTAFLFKAVTGAEFRNITFIGPNGNTHISGSGYMGCIRVWSTAKIIDCTFINWDKWAVDVRGDRKVMTDTTYIFRSVFSGTKRDGYGYSVWSQYGTVRIDSCTFTDGRHFIDGGSEGHRFIISNSAFDGAYASAIHTHEYRDGYSGAGIDLINCWFGKNAVNIDIDPPFPPAVNRMEGLTYWNGQGTSFWIKAHNAIVEVYQDGIMREVIGTDEWTYHTFRYKATIRIFGIGVVYIDDYIEPYASRYYTMEDNAIPKIRYITPAKVDRFVGDRVSGDRSLRVRVEAQAVDVW